MKKLSTIILILSLLIVNGFAKGEPKHGKLFLNIDNIAVQTGILHVVLYIQPVGFPHNFNNSFMHLTIDLSNPNAAKEFTSIPFNEYAIVFYYDENNNGSLDYNWVDKPKEPYGFSNPNMKRWFTTFDACAFQFTENEQVISLTFDEKVNQEFINQNLVTVK